MKRKTVYWLIVYGMKWEHFSEQLIADAAAFYCKWPATVKRGWIKL